LVSFHDESHRFVLTRDIQSLDFAVGAAAENMPYRLSVFVQGAKCVSCDCLSFHIGCSVSADTAVGNFLVPQDTVLHPESVLLVS
jgi:hypothetical protein